MINSFKLKNMAAVSTVRTFMNSITLPTLYKKVGKFKRRIIIIRESGGQLGIFKGRVPNQKKGTLQIISRTDVTRDISFSNSESQGGNKGYFFNFHLSKTYQSTNMSTLKLKQFERGTGNASGASWEEVQRLTREEVF